MKSSILTTHENCEGSTSLTRRIRNSKKPLRMLVRNWKHQLLLLSPAKLWRRIVGVVHPIQSKQDLRVFWKVVNLQDCVWENHYQIIMKTILQEKETIHYSIKYWFTNLFLCLKPWKFQQQMQQWTRNGKNWRKFRRGTWRKSEARKRWSMKQGRTAQKYISHHWWTYVIWKMLNCRQSTKNTKVELYSEVIPWKTTQGLMQYSPNKDHQHHKWRQQKSWISTPDCLVALDKQLTQYLLIPR